MGDPAPRPRGRRRDDSRHLSGGQTLLRRARRAAGRGTRRRRRSRDPVLDERPRLLLGGSRVSGAARPRLVPHREAQHRRLGGLRAGGRRRLLYAAHDAVPLWRRSPLGGALVVEAGPGGGAPPVPDGPDHRLRGSRAAHGRPLRPGAVQQRAPAADRQSIGASQAVDGVHPSRAGVLPGAVADVARRRSGGAAVGLRRNRDRRGARPSPRVRAARPPGGQRRRLVCRIAVGPEAGAIRSRLAVPAPTVFRTGRGRVAAGLVAARQPVNGAVARFRPGRHRLRWGADAHARIGLRLRRDRDLPRSGGRRPLPGGTSHGTRSGVQRAAGRRSPGVPVPATRDSRAVLERPGPRRTGRGALHRGQRALGAHPDGHGAARWCQRLRVCSTGARPAVPLGERVRSPAPLSPGQRCSSTR